MGERKGAYRVLVWEGGNLKERGRFEYLDIVGRIIFK